MAITASRVVAPEVEGARRITVTDVTFDSSYVTGGMAVAPSDLGLVVVDFAATNLKTPAASVVDVAYIPATSKLKANLVTAEVTAATNLSALVVTVVAFGR